MASCPSARSDGCARPHSAGAYLVRRRSELTTISVSLRAAPQQIPDDLLPTSRGVASRAGEAGTSRCLRRVEHLPAGTAAAPPESAQSACAHRSWTTAAASARRRRRSARSTATGTSGVANARPSGNARTAIPARGASDRSSTTRSDHVSRPLERRRVGRTRRSVPITISRAMRHDDRLGHAGTCFPPSFRLPRDAHATSAAKHRRASGVDMPATAAGRTPAKTSLPIVVRQSVGASIAIPYAGRRSFQGPRRPRKRSRGTAFALAVECPTVRARDRSPRAADRSAQLQPHSACCAALIPLRSASSRER